MSIKNQKFTSQQEMEQATAQSGFGDMSISKKSQAPQFILG